MTVEAIGPSSLIYPCVLRLSRCGNVLREPKAKTLGPAIANVLKKDVTAQTPARQELLWAACDELPRMVSLDLTTEFPAEKTFAQRLANAAKILRLPPLSKVVSKP